LGSFGGNGAMVAIKTAAPQFLVDNLTDSLAFYEERLGFRTDFVYGGFYASVSRDGAPIHLKCAPKLQAERAHRKSGEHLDVFLEVSGIRELYEELAGRGVRINKPLEERPWGAIDFYVEDPDGYILCFSEAAQQAAAAGRTLRQPVE
jgi:catechol 2,3-dioxygenase-like lactoylglutathione lyase family enzyme